MRPAGAFFFLFSFWAATILSQTSFKSPPPSLLQANWSLLPTFCLWNLQKLMVSLLFHSMMQAGCSKIYITSRKAQACDDAVRALNALPNRHPGAQAIAIPADLAKVSEIERLAAEVA